MRQAARRYKLFWLAAAVAAVACDRLLTDPTTGVAEFAIRFAIYEGPPGGTEEAFGRVSSVFLTFTRPDGTARDTTVSVTAEDGEIRASMRLETDEQIESLGIDARLGYGTAEAPVALFEGSTTVRIEPGVPTTAAIDVTPVPASVIADPPGLVIPNVGETAQLTSAVLFASEDTITGLAGTWTSLDASVVSVTSEGLATAQQLGQTQLVVTYDGLTDTVPVTVSSIADGTVTPAESTVFRGETVQYSVAWQDALGNPLTGRTVTWETTDPAVATIDAGGLLTAVAAGGVTVSATAEGVSATASLTVLEPIASIVVTPDPATVIEGQTVQLSASPLDGLGDPLTGRTMTWSTDDAAVATVDQTGLVTGIAAGAARISASAEGVTGTSDVTVVQSGLVSWTNTSGGSWSDPANWNTGAVPTAADDVEITAAGAYTVSVDVDASAASITVAGSATLDLTGGSATVTGAVAVQDGAGMIFGGSGSLDAAQLSLAAGAEALLDNGQITASVDIDGALRTRGASSISGVVSVGPAGTLSIEGGAGGATVLALDSDLTNVGTVELTEYTDGTGSSLSLGGATLVNDGGGSLRVDDPYGNATYAISGSVDNRGVFTVNRPLTLSDASAAHLNGGTFTANADVTIQLADGTFANMAGGVMDIAGGLVVVDIAGAGSVTTAGDISTAADLGLVVNGGTFDYAGGSWTGGGGVRVSQSDATLAAPLTLAAGFSLQDANLSGAALTVGPSGRLVKEGFGTSSVDVAIDNQGVIEVLEGDLVLNGALSTAAGSALQLQDRNGGTSSLVVASGFANNGTIQLANQSVGGSAVFEVITGAVLNSVSGNVSAEVGAGGGTRIWNGDVDNRGTITVGAPLEITGTLVVPASDAATIVSANESTLTVNGLDVDGATFDGAPLITNGALIAFDNVTFQNISPDLTQLAINNPGAPTPFTLDGLSFLTVPSAGLYISATDNVADANVLTINLTNSSPPDGSAATATAGGARVNWPGLAVQWLGGNGNWGDASNWSTGVVPGPTDAVEIAVAGSYFVTVDVDPTIASLTIGNPSGSQFVDLTGRSLGVSGDVTVLGGGFLSLDATSSLDAATVTIDAGASAFLGSSVITATEVDVLGTLATYDVSGINGVLATAPGGVVSIEGDAGVPALLSLVDELQNAGLLRLTQIGDGGPATLAMAGGDLRNEATGTILVDDPFGTVTHVISGGRIDNLGTITVNVPLTIDAPGRVHSNDGTFTTTVDVTFNLGEGTFSHSANGVLDVQSGFIYVNGTGAALVEAFGDIVTGLDSGLWIDGAELQYTAGTWSGTGGVAVVSGTVALLQPLTLPTHLAIRNTAVSGAALAITGTGHLENLSTGTSEVNVDIDNQGTIRAASGQLTLNGALTTSEASTIQVRPESATPATLTMASGFTSNGLMEIGEGSADSGALLELQSGTLINSSTGTIRVDPGSVGGEPRVVDGDLDQRGTLTLNTDLAVSGQLIVPASDAATIDSGNGSVLSVSGVDVSGAIFDGARLTTTDGALTTFDDVTFQNIDPEATPLTVTHPGAPAPFVFDGLSFLTTPTTTGFYISATDNAADANVLTIDLTNSTPADGSAFTATSGGAVVNWGGASPPISLGATILGDIAEPGEIDTYTFSGTVGDVVTVALGEVSGFSADNVYAELISPSGGLVGAVNFNVDADPEFTLSETGVYRLDVRAIGLTGTGQYGVTVEGVSTPSSDAVATVVGEVVEGDLVGVADVDEYTFTANADEVVTLALAELSGFPTTFPQAYLFAPSGTELGGVNAGGSVELTLSETGTYVVQVHSSGTFNLGMVDTGSYALGVEGVSPATGTALTLGTIALGDVATAAEIDSYTFDGAAGDVVTVALGEVSGFSAENVYAELISPSGGLVGTVNFNVDADPEFTLSETGSHVLQIHAFGLTGTGQYGVTVEGVSKPSADAVVIAVGEVFQSDLVSVADVDEYTFTANADEVVTLALRELSGFPTTFPQAFLFAPSGAELGGVNAGGSTEIPLSETGTYVVQVHSSGTFNLGMVDTGSYSLELTPAPAGADGFVLRKSGPGGAEANVTPYRASPR